MSEREPAPRRLIATEPVKCYGPKGYQPQDQTDHLVNDPLTCPSYPPDPVNASPLAIKSQMEGDKRLMKKPKWPKESYLMVSPYAVTHLSQPALLLLMFLVQHSKANGLVEIGQKDITEQSGLSKSKVERASKELVGGHWIHARRTPGVKVYNVNPAAPHVKKPPEDRLRKNYGIAILKSAESLIVDFPSGLHKSVESYSTTVQVHDNEAQSGLTPETHDDPPFIPDTER